MTEPWFDPNTFGAWFGAIVGGLGGSLFGLVGALSGYLIPRNRGWVLLQAAMTFFLVMGVVFLTFFAAALIAGQPFGIWFGPLLSGGLFLILSLGGLVMLRGFRKLMEQRRLESEGLRNL